MNFLTQPLSSGQAWFAASAGLVLLVAAYYEHARRRETPQAVGLALAAFGIFLWAALQGPIFYIFVIIAVAVLIPWLIWGRRAREARSAILDRSPIVVQRRSRAPVVPEGARGVLDFRRDGERALKTMVAVLVEMNREMERQNKRLPRHRRRLERATRRGSGIERTYRLSDRAARDIKRHASDMARLEVRLREARESMIDNFTDWLRNQSSSPELDEVRSNLHEMGKVSGEGRKGTAAYQKSVRGLRRQNISQPVNRAADRLDAVITKIVEDIAATERFCQREGRRRPNPNSP